MERRYFGPTSATGIFHNEVAKALRGVPGCNTIHDNILVWGKDYEDHRRKLRATLEICKEKGITLKLKKSTFCRQEVTWFGRTFSATGVSADPKKINAIFEAGRPKLISFLKHSQELMEHNEALEEEIAFKNVKLLLGREIRLPNSLKRSMRRSFIRESFENWNKKLMN